MSYFGLTGSVIQTHFCTYRGTCEGIFAYKILLQLVKFPGQWKGTRWQDYEMYGAAGIRAGLTKRWNKAADSEEIPTYNAIVHFLILHQHNAIIFWLHFLYNLNLWFSYHSGWIMTLYDFNNVPKVQGTYVQSSYYNIVQCTSAQSVKNAAWLSSPSCEDLAPSQSIELGQACTAHRTPYTAHRTLHNA